MEMKCHMSPQNTQRRNLAFALVMRKFDWTEESKLQSEDYRQYWTPPVYFQFNNAMAR